MSESVRCYGPEHTDSGVKCPYKVRGNVCIDSPSYRPGDFDSYCDSCRFKKDLRAESGLVQLSLK